MTQSLYFVISNFAVLIFSKISDNKGRKYTILITYIIGMHWLNYLGTIPLIFASFVNNYVQFMVLLIISGIGMSPYVLMCFVLLSESAGEKCRFVI